MSSSNPTSTTTTSSGGVNLSQDVIGLCLRVKTLNGDTYEGSVFAYEADNNLVILHEPSEHPNRSNFRFFKGEALSEIIHIEKPTSSVATGPRGSGSPCSPMDRVPDFLNPEARLSKINLPKIVEHAENAAIGRAKKMSAEVTIEAQDIFDAMSRTYPCTWDHNAIVILGEVRIDHPYTAEKVHANRPDGRSSDDKSLESTIDRVRKVLEGVRKKLNLGSTASSSSTSKKT